VPPETLSAYAGPYQVSGRDVVVAISGDQLLVKDSAYPKDQLFVATSQTEFLSSVSETTIAFVKDASGRVTHFTRRAGPKDEKAVRAGGIAQR
jgi:hypothetical protein